MANSIYSVENRIADIKSHMTCLESFYSNESSQDMKNIPQLIHISGVANSLLTFIADIEKYPLKSEEYSEIDEINRKLVIMILTIDKLLKNKFSSSNDEDDSASEHTDIITSDDEDNFASGHSDVITSDEDEDDFASEHSVSVNSTYSDYESDSEIKSAGTTPQREDTFSRSAIPFFKHKTNEVVSSDNGNRSRLTHSY